MSSSPRSWIVIGRGRLGRALAGALPHAGGAPVLLGGRESAADPDGVDLALSSASANPVLVLAVRDEALRGLASRIADAVAELPTGAAALHSSGALDLDALAPLARRGFATGSCHPLQTFTGGERDAGRLASATFAIDGEGPGRDAAFDLARALGGRPLAVPPSGRALYHLAASLGANGLTGLVAAARDALAAAGPLEPPEALRALAPLLRAALEEALEHGPEAALTGPAARGDDATLERHRQAVTRWDATRLSLLEALLREQHRLVARGGDGTGC